MGIERALNRWLLRRGLRGVLPGSEEPAAIVTTLPITADLAQAWSHLNWIYYCVDDLAAWPGLDAGTLQRMEREQLPHMRTVLAASTALRDRMNGLGCDAHLLTHGVDIARWRGVGPRRRAPSDRPVVLFWGLADRRLDTAICLALAREVTVRMVGPRQDVDPRLRAEPGIIWEDAVAEGELPRVATTADVLVMPYADLAVTRAMQPLKLLEYLATELPVVATPLPANREWSAALDVAGDPERFTAIALERARTGLPPAQRAARARVAAESWSAKAAELERLCLMTAPRA
jgi:glycosyltransferase involved in cell wall biosynthesis